MKKTYFHFLLCSFTLTGESPAAKDIPPPSVNGSVSPAQPDQPSARPAEPSDQPSVQPDQPSGKSPTDDSASSSPKAEKMVDLADTPPPASGDEEDDDGGGGYVEGDDNDYEYNDGGADDDDGGCVV